MPSLRPRDRAFLRKYQTEFTRYTKAAVEAHRHIEAALSGIVLPIHAVTYRPKTVNSLRGKLRRKRYHNPQSGVTDLVGVRVITYFGRDIDRVANTLRSRLEISERKSRDARAELQENQFGYRSIHLIAKFPLSAMRIEGFQKLRCSWFEIQIRSILDHAWSEIEHEVVYKSGIEYPSDVKRRFKAVAGSLEVLEHAFHELSAERDGLIDRYKHEYKQGIGGERRLDVARLQAFLEVTFPSGLSWRKAEQQGTPFPSGLAVASVDALDVVRLRTAGKLHEVLKTSRFKRMLRDFSSLEGINPHEVSHLAVVVLAVASIRPQVVRVQFPEMLYSPSINGLINT